MSKRKTTAPAPEQQLRAALVRLYNRLAYEAAEFDRARQADRLDPLPPEGETEIVTEDGRTVTTFFLPERTAGLVERWRAPHVIQQLERAALRLCPAAGWMAADCRTTILAATDAHETLLSTWSDADAFERNLVTQNAAWLRLGRLVEELPAQGAPRQQHRSEHRGTAKTRTRKIDVAITLVVRNPELSEAEVARQVPCSESYLSQNREYQKNAEMARRALARAQKASAHDRRTGTTEPVVYDPHDDLT